MLFKTLCMKILCPFFCIFFFVLFASGQQSKFSIAAHYGIQNNFFVTSYDESPNAIFQNSFYKKSAVGTIGGLELKYQLGKRGSLGFGYAGSVNSRTVSYTTTINTVFLGIYDFKITHKNRFFQFGYEYALQKKKPTTFIEAGVFYLRSNQQEIDISQSRREILIEERNFSNSKLEEGGLFIGLSYMRNIDTKFKFGIKSRLYYLASTNTVEALTLTPVLSFTF